MKRFKKKYSIAGAIFIILLILYYFSLPRKLFYDPYSTILEDKNEELLSASIAADGQWRFPQLKETPEKFTQALVAYEDKRFYHHPGVDILSLARACRQNSKALKVVSGASTISMQVIRLSRQKKARTLLEKIIEIILATRLELRYSKKEILALYASHAPFGGNVVGMEAACWRYFNRGPQQLSWGEAAMLAVLPNSPSLIHLGKNRKKLMVKRNKLLDRLKATGVIDDVTCTLAKTEPIPEEPHPLPRYARHLLNRMHNDGLGQQRIKSTLAITLQQRVEQILADHHRQLKANQVHNAAAIVLSVESGNVLAYVGNTQNNESQHGDEVDLIASPRSTGSILKPFLFAAMLDDGKLLQKTLLPDIPTVISGFAPKNFSKQYDGAVSADKALIRSLNVPAVCMLRDYRYEKFHTLLKALGMTTLNKPADHYGLTLILGGAEGTLWDITGMYASMARSLNHFFEHPGKNKYSINDAHQPVYVSSDSIITGRHAENLEETSTLSAASIYLTFDVLKEVYRPGEESGWRYFNSSKKIAWKTGTSFGFRDGWAIGVTPDYAVGVWVGNADGEGRPGLTGTDAAAPIMFDIFSQLPGKTWFEKPKLEMTEITICSQSGHRISENCQTTEPLLVSKTGLETLPCPYHKTVHLSNDQKFRVNSACAAVDRMKHVKWFVLPPVQEHYFKSKNISYKSLPPFRKDCISSSVIANMEMVYPKPHARIFIPRDLDGKLGNTVFELAHRNPKIMVYWHLDGDYIGYTRGLHSIALAPQKGKHRLNLIDENGESLEYFFEVVSKNTGH